MERLDLLHLVTSVLEKLNIPYFVTGSSASIQFGEPRFSNDIDVVVKLTVDQVNALCAEFPLDAFYVSEEAARDAIQHHSPHIRSEGGFDCCEG